MIPNIGKLELLYLESQLVSDGGESNSVRDPRAHLWLNNGHDHSNSDPNSAYSIASDIDIKQYCRAIDLPGFEDNISPGNPMRASIQLSVSDACLVFDRASGSSSKSYLYLNAEDFNFDVGLMAYGPAVQLSVRSVRLTDRQSRTLLGHDVELFSITGKHEVSCLCVHIIVISSHFQGINCLYRYVAPSCPDFKSVFKSVEHSLVCDTSNVQFVLHKTSLWTLTNAASFILEK